MSYVRTLNELENQLHTITHEHVFIRKFYPLLTVEKQPAVSLMRDPFDWVLSEGKIALLPQWILLLSACRLMLDETFSRFEPLPAEIQDLSSNVGVNLKKAFDKLVQTSDWEFQAGNFRLRRDVDKSFPAFPSLAQRQLPNY
jgi:hypothetical protein